MVIQSYYANHYANPDTKRQTETRHVVYTMPINSALADVGGR